MVSKPLSSSVQVRLSPFAPQLPDATTVPPVGISGFVGASGASGLVKNKLLATTSYQTFDVYYHVDPTLIGGMVIRVGDRVVDSSIRTKLEDMKKQLLNIQLG